MEKKNEQLSTPRGVKTMQTKEKIYSAAVSIMKKHGYDYLSVKNICQVAGVSNGTFFYHFKNKDDLLSYYLFERFNRYLASTEIDFASMPFDERLITRYIIYADYVKENGIDFVKNYYTPKNKALNTRSARDHRDIQMVDQCVDILQSGIDTHAIKATHTAREYTDNTCTILKGIMFDWAVSDGILDTTAMIRLLVGAYLDSIKI
ncbi:MAG: TetR/AcrR family transcriptional regulator [Oscillospiraceae bacterium]